MELKAIHKAMVSIQQEFLPIPKEKRNSQQGYSFRGIEDAYRFAQQLMAKHGVHMTGEIIRMEREPAISANGKAMFFTILHYRWYYWSMEDGSHVTHDSVGEANDLSDKATIKAMSVSQKYAILQPFLVPTSEAKKSDRDDRQVDTEEDHNEVLEPVKPPLLPKRFESEPGEKYEANNSQKQYFAKICHQFGIEDRAAMSALSDKLLGAKMEDLNKMIQGETFF